jgi:hypothetical protein
MTARMPEDPKEWTEWFVTAARFERTAAPEILPTDRVSRKRVVIKGRWVETDDGSVLHRIGWQKLRDPAMREE